MKNYIAVAVALGVIGLIFFFKPPSQELPAGAPEPTGINFPSFSPSLPIIELPGIGNSAIGQEAFSVFRRYIGFAGERNIAGLSSLSYSLSPACRSALEGGDQEQIDECNRLMDSVYFFAEGFKEEDFKHVYYDDRQVVMLTDFFLPKGAPAEADSSSASLFFIRTDEGLKLLGIQFCSRKATATGHCVETDPAKRDKNQNGWWDHIESLFR
jgi:hypothetical protein